MALPIRNHVASTAVSQAMKQAKALRDNVTTWKASIEAGGANATQVINVMQGIKGARDILAEYVTVSGIDAVAREEYNDPTLNFTDELNAVIAACDTTLSWINTNMPKDGSGYLLLFKITNSAIDPRTFTAGGLSGLSTQLGVLLATFS